MARRARRGAVLGHVGAQAIERVGGDACPIAQAADELAVIDNEPAEGRFRKPHVAAEVPDLVEDLA
jgi:hypothetical protein